jgi:hypothetical protein
MPKHKVICPYCQQPATCEDSAVVYRRSFGFIWICRCLPKWSYVGCRGKTKRPLGTLANAQTREFRKRAHSIFDPMWKRGLMTRQEAYIWLGAELGLSPEQAHIARSDVDQCIAIISACKRRVAG